MLLWLQSLVVVSYRTFLPNSYEALKSLKLFCMKDRVVEILQVLKKTDLAFFKITTIQRSKIRIRVHCTICSYHRGPTLSFLTTIRTSLLSSVCLLSYHFKTSSFMSTRCAQRPIATLIKFVLRVQ